MTSGIACDILEIWHGGLDVDSALYHNHVWPWRELEIKNHYEDDLPLDIMQLTRLPKPPAQADLNVDKIEIVWSPVLVSACVDT